MVKNEQGQASVEFILIASVLVTISITIYSELRSRNVLPNLVNGPSDYLTGMVENGVWEPVNQGRNKHPGYAKRKVATKN